MLPIACPAGSLYAGRGFQLARQAAEARNAALYIVSAGLGLVAADCEIPAYGLTVGGRGPESVSGRTRGRFDPAAWWRAVATGPFSTPLADVFARGAPGPVLIALTQPYALMLAPELERLPRDALHRLRVVGTKLETLLPVRLADCVLPYDERLDSVLPGTRADFPQRALMHFVTCGLSALPRAEAADHRDWVLATLADRHAPQRPQRPRLSDEAILSLIERHLTTTRGVGRLLRVLRDKEGIACEQARFTRLYWAAIERRTAA